MPKVSWMQNSFNAGEFSPRLIGRVDLGKYKSGCQILENFIPLIYGPVRKRPGTRFVQEVKNSNVARLIPFEYSTEQAYILEFGEEYIRFYKNGGYILDGATPYEIATPYASADVDTIHFAQSADVMYLAHPNYPPYKLSRYGDTNWTIEKVEFRAPPFNDENETDITITASAIDGTVTLTASASLFTSSDVGTYFRIEETLASKYDRWDTEITITAGDYRWYADVLYVADTSGTTGIRPPVHFEGTESDGGVDWTFVNTGFGYAEITGYTSATEVTADVIISLPPSSLSGSKRWSDSAWSDVYGYPKAVSFYEDRLWFAGSLNKPQTLWASVTSSYEDHSYGENDDDALNYTINSQEVNTIEWISPSRVLAIGTSGGEFVASANSPTSPITPTDIRIVPYTTYGGVDIQPFRVGNSTLFVQRAKRKIREYVYDFNTDSYVAPDMTLLSEHITDSGIVDTSYQQEPDQILWVVDQNGSLLGMTYERSEDVIGWHRHSVGGEIESIATIPHWDGDQNSLWMIVKRTINGSVVRYVEYLEKEIVNDATFYVDSGLTYTGSAVSTISGLDHLEGEEVSILADGAVHPNRTVSSGSISLQLEAETVVVGLGYESTLQTMSIEAGAADGVAQGKQMRVTNTCMRLYQTGPGLFYGPNEDKLDQLHFRSSVMDMDEPVPLFTGITSIKPYPQGYENSTSLMIKHTTPLPCTVVGIMAQLVTYDR